MNKVFGILRNEDDNSARRWVNACEAANVEYIVIDFTRADWFEKVNDPRIDYFLVKPPGQITKYKHLFDQRLYILSKVMKKPMYPSYEEIIIHENKETLSYFLKAKGIPHPATNLFYYKDEAINFVKNHDLPLVAKTSIGGSGSGVKVLRSVADAEKYITTAFGKGIKKRFGPNRVTGTPKKWFNKAISDIPAAIKKIKNYIAFYGDAQRGFVIFQDYIPHEYEWRSVMINDSFFAHQKVKMGDKASGSKGIDYVNPPESILDFTRNICIENGFKSMAIDIFEDANGNYLVNEMQTIFGHVQDFILAVDGKPGRFVYSENEWVFEAGDFNENESYNIRLKGILEELEK
ncbi:MAG: hypothetical protein SCALA702_33710 [Melioribacteraceae bacterium]|nr:MAG: hypothetical protein SCALA702_33710 [Melioribacteraceae bacterium]